MVGFLLSVKITTTPDWSWKVGLTEWSRQRHRQCLLMRSAMVHKLILQSPKKGKNRNSKNSLDTKRLCRQFAWHWQDRQIEANINSRWDTARRFRSWIWNDPYRLSDVDRGCVPDVQVQMAREKKISIPTGGRTNSTRLLWSQGTDCMFSRAAGGGDKERRMYDSVSKWL